MLEQERFEEFSSLISCVHGNIQKLKARYTTQLGLKAVHVFWIYLLRIHPEGMSASELAAAGQSDRSLVSREINTLFDKGIISARNNENQRNSNNCNGNNYNDNNYHGNYYHGDKRRYGWKLTLTDRGRELADIISAVAADIQNTVSRDIPEKDLIMFYRTLRTLAEELGVLEKNNHVQEVIDKWL